MPSGQGEGSDSRTESRRLIITEDGLICGLWSDDLSLHEIGRCSVRRASLVEYDNVAGMWTVRADVPWWRRLFNVGRILFSSPSRDAALAWEREWFSPGGGGWETLQCRKRLGI